MRKPYETKVPVSLRWEYILQGLLEPSGITMDHGIGKAKGPHDFDFDYIWSSLLAGYKHLVCG